MLETIMLVLDNYGNLFVEGLWVTLYLSAFTVFFGAIFGSLIAMVKMSKFAPLRFLATCYVEVIRGTPLLLQLYFFYFLLPQLIGADLSKVTSVLIALIINSAGYIAEIVRAGIQAVDKGQTEAARSLGLNGTQTMIKIILPQAIKNILPALANEFVTIIKETSLASTFYIGDLMTQYRKINGALYLTIEPLIIVGVIYFIVTFTLSKIIEVFERRMGAGD